MNARKTFASLLFVTLLTISSVMGLIPLTISTPAVTVSLQADEALARARNTVNNRLSDIRIPTPNAPLTPNFRPTTHTYHLTVHQDRGRAVIEPRRELGKNQNIRHRIDNRRADRTWNNGSWSSWRSGTNANNRINVDLNHGQERRVQIAVRDENGNIRTYTVHARRAAPDAWGANLRANAGTFNRAFSRSVMNYTLTIPHDRQSVTVSMDGARSNAQLRTRIGTGDWSARTWSTTSRNVSVPQGGSRTLQIQVRGAFSAQAPSSTHTQTYTITINRAAPPAQNPNTVPTFTFSGVGWGHGVGMSQNGAMQMAREGRTFSQILNHYFTGITIAERTPANRMRVNLDADRANRTSWTIGPRNGTSDAAIIINGTSFNGANGLYTFTVSGGNIKMTNRNGTVQNIGKRNKIEITSSGTGDNRLLTVMDQSGPPLPSASHRFVRYRGTLELAVVNGRLRLVNELPMRDYLFGVVPREIPTSEGVRAAVEAQAIAARSYAHSNTGNATGVSSTVSFQVYGGHSRFASEANWRSGNTVSNLEHSVSNAAVISTGNRVILHGGNIVRAYYSACNGDRTANSEDIWSANLGYLRSVNDPFCSRSGHAGHSWTVTMTGMELANRLRQNGSSVPSGAGSTVYVKSLSRNLATGGWVKTLTVNWSDGSTTSISNADNVRIRLGLRSANFSVTRTLSTI